VKRQRDDGWYESEEWTRVGMIAELQRIRRRMVVRPWPVIALAIVITAAVVYRVVSKQRLYTADVVLAMNEGVIGNSQKDNSIPFDQLKEYVWNVLIPDKEVLKIIEKRMPGRVAAVGAPFALESFRERVEIFIWKNSFSYYDPEDANTQKSARIGIDVTADDPDDAYQIALDLGNVAIATHDAQRLKLAQDISKEVALARTTLSNKLDELDADLAAKQTALDTAKRIGNNEQAATLLVDIATLTQSLKRASDALKSFDTNPALFAGAATEAKLGITLSIVDHFKPERIEMSGLVLAMLIAVIGTFALLGSALVLGAFDSRVHDTDDVARLGLPVLGHVPGFPGDHVGSLDARGAFRARVPSSLRWRSHR
jgi:capsular polysaccharide biosynthesis protein